MVTCGLVAAVLVLAGLALGLWRKLCRTEAARARAEEASAAAVREADRKSAQWQATVAGMPDGLMVLDADMRLVEWNRHLPEFTGVPPEVLQVGMLIEDILRAQALAGEFGPVDVEAEVRRRTEAMTAGISTGTIERKRPNGTIMQLRRSCLEDGGFVTLYTDVTERRRVEDQLRQAQKMEAIGQLTGGVAHDFNNLLTVVLGNLEMAQNALEASNALRAREKIDEARAGAERGATLTRRLLAFSRRQTLEPRPVDANRVVSDMSELIRSTIGGIAFEVALAGGLWETMIDPNQLDNALLNLAINARDAMPNGGKITIETANAHLDAAYAAAHDEVTPGQYVMIAMTDTGIGMSDDAQTRAFEPFFTTKEVGKGSGLGLSQVFGFIKQSKGHVKIYSEVGVGTTVKLYLPRHLSEPHITAESTAVPQRPVPRAKDGEIVLLVEDDADVAAYTMETLEILGYYVVTAQDAAVALVALKTYPAISLLLTDVELPGLNGPDLVDEVWSRRPGLPVLYTTGYPAMAVLHCELLERDVKTIHKPFLLADLAAAVRDAIDHPSL